VTAVAGAGWIAAPDTPGTAAPLRAVDAWRVESSGDPVRLTARVGVRGDDPNLRGHFPGLAVFPGIFVIEALCQAVSLALPESAPVLTNVRSVRFVAPLLDGDELTLEAAVSPRAGGGWAAEARGTRADGTVCARIRADFDEGPFPEGPAADA
jgi:3-hydroxyacyl-[acyl-carrier-protein] dehydratase